MPVNVIRSPSSLRLPAPLPRAPSGDVTERDLLGAQLQQGGQDNQLLTILLTLLSQRQSGDADRELERDVLAIRKDLENNQQKEFTRAAKAQELLSGRGFELQEMNFEVNKQSIEDARASLARDRIDQLSVSDRGLFTDEIKAEIGVEQSRFADSAQKGAEATQLLAGPLRVPFGKVATRVADGQEPRASDVRDAKAAMRTVGRRVAELVAELTVRGAPASEIDSAIGAYQNELRAFNNQVGSAGGLDTLLIKQVNILGEVRRSIGFDAGSFATDLGRQATDLAREGQLSIRGETSRFRQGTAEEIRERQATEGFNPALPDVRSSFSALGNQFPPGSIETDDDLGVSFEVPADLSSLEALISGADNAESPSPFTPFQEARRGAAESTAQTRKDVQESIGSGLGAGVGALEGLLGRSPGRSLVRSQFEIDGKVLPFAELEAEAKRRGITLDQVLAEVLSEGGTP